MKAVTDLIVNYEVCCRSVAKSRPTLRDPMDCSTPGLPARHQHQIITFHTLNMDHVICQLYLNKAGGGMKTNNRIKLTLLCFYVLHILSRECVFIPTGTFAILENASKGCGPWSALGTGRVSVVSLTLPTWSHPSGLCQQLQKSQNSPQWGPTVRQLCLQMTGRAM